MVDKTLVHVAAITVNKIEAIRTIRNVTGLSLMEAKEVIEAICSNSSIVGVTGITSCHVGTHELILDLDQVVKGCEID